MKICARNKGAFQIDRGNQNFRFSTFGPPKGNSYQKIDLWSPFFDPRTLAQYIGNKKVEIDTFLAVRLFGNGTP